MAAYAHEDEVERGLRRIVDLRHRVLLALQTSLERRWGGGGGGRAMAGQAEGMVGEEREPRQGGRARRGYSESATSAFALAVTLHAAHSGERTGHVALSLGRPEIEAPPPPDPDVPLPIPHGAHAARQRVPPDMARPGPATTRPGTKHVCCPQPRASEALTRARSPPILRSPGHPAIQPVLRAHPTAPGVRNERASTSIQAEQQPARERTCPPSAGAPPFPELAPMRCPLRRRA
ncbi:hypothetical protein TRAPUB_681 [Trametes pubescens]|uniref:Uncharacterized protein n=1 Tax=Trametes pubescens TaxID=154538 RepID=A0A1M2VLP4_TRAPU|nr:hypothetical protein TRAPUB_681 [Trametes pubescens]